MPYTTQSCMTADDVRDWEEDNDVGSIEIDMAAVPEWFDATGTCPLEGAPYADHEWLTVGRASGEPWDCDLS